MWKLTWSNASRRAQILNSTSSVILTTDSLYSKSLIEYATKYVDIGTVTWKCDHTHSGFPFLKGKIDPSIIQRIVDISMCILTYRGSFWPACYLKHCTSFRGPKWFRILLQLVKENVDLKIPMLNTHTHTPFISGSSKQGNARRAKVDSNCVTEIHLKVYDFLVFWG